ncbi:MAG: hypothetical protein ABIV43_01510 [Candidatus Saccharimonadales bacterium]
MRQRQTPHDHDPPFVTPVDEFSGLPWVILPPDYALPAHRSDLADDNHAFHPSRSPLLNTPAGIALRNARVQRVNWYDHHMVYHKYFSGPEIPSDPADIFRRVVFAVARYIPDMAIDCDGYEPEAVPITDQQKDRLWRSGELRVARPGVVRGFLGNYVAGQDLSHVSESKIDEFLHTSDNRQSLFLGQWLLAQATEVATEPISGQYQLAHKAGNIAPNLTGKTPNLVKNTLGNKFETSPYVKLLRERLVA